MLTPILTVRHLIFYTNSCNLCVVLLPRVANKLPHYEAKTVVSHCVARSLSICLFFWPYSRSPSIWSYGLSSLATPCIFINTNGTSAILRHYPSKLEAVGSRSWSRRDKNERRWDEMKHHQSCLAKPMFINSFASGTSPSCSAFAVTHRII